MPTLKFDRKEEGRESLAILLGKPDLLALEGLFEARGEWEAMKGLSPEELAQQGFLTKVNNFVAEYLPAVCLSHKIGVIEEGKKEPENADLYISRTRGHRGDFSGDEQIEIFVAISETIDELAKGMEKASARAETFREVSVRGNPKPDSDALESPPE